MNPDFEETELEALFNVVDFVLFSNSTVLQNYYVCCFVCFENRVLKLTIFSKNVYEA